MGEALGGQPASPQTTARRGSRGASLVEFALILPVFAMLLFGMISAGLALNEKQQMTHATREGARYAATVPAAQEFDLDGDGTPNEAADGETWAQVVRDLIVERSTGSLNAADVCVSLVTGSAGNASAPLQVVSPSNEYSTASGSSPCIPGQTYAVTALDDGLRVQVTATRPAEIELILFGSYPVTLQSEATARSESDL